MREPKLMVTRARLALCLHNVVDVAAMMVAF